MELITKEKLDEWHASHRKMGDLYSDRMLDFYLQGRDGLTLEQVLDLDIPPKHRFWVANKALPPEIMAEFAARCARRAVENMTFESEVLQDWATRWLAGDSDSDECFELFCSLDGQTAEAAALGAAYHATRGGQRSDCLRAIQASAVAPCRVARLQAIVDDEDVHWIDTLLPEETWQLERLKALIGGM